MTGVQPCAPHTPLLPGTASLPTTSDRPTMFAKTKTTNLPAAIPMISAIPDLPVAAGLFSLTLIHLLYPLPTIAFAFALIAAVVGFLHISLLLRRASARLPRPVSVGMLMLAAAALLASHVAASRAKAEGAGISRSSGSDFRSIQSTVPKRVTGKPTDTRAVSVVDSAKANARKAGDLGRRDIEMAQALSSVSRADLKSGNPVDALRAVERSQLAMPNAGDWDTELHENKLDETRTSSAHSLATSTSARNGSFIVTSLTEESCSAACARFHYVCSPKMFHKVNSCPTLLIWLPCRQCKEVQSSHKLAASLPGGVRSKWKSKRSKPDSIFTCFRLSDKKGEIPQCHVSATDVKRLCPCVA